MEEEVEEVEMESVGEDTEASGSIPFQLQFDKPVPFQVKMAEWNPEKDLLAIVTDESKVLLHRFNWQRLWTIIPGKSITSLCWSPDGKLIALGTEDGSIFLHDVENGKMLRSMRTHDAAVICLNWEEDALKAVDRDRHFVYEDRTTRFFPPPPQVPRIPGLSDGDLEETTQQLSSVSCQRFNILCSGDRDGCICFSIFGIFPIGKINIHNILLPNHLGTNYQYQLKNASISKVALSRDLCRLEVLCFGELIELGTSPKNNDTLVGFHCLNLDTSIFLNRKNELHQVAQQASNIEDVVEVVRASISVMSKQWTDAMSLFKSKFQAIASLIAEHGLDSNSQDEFLSLLLGVRTSPALQQFLLNTLGEAGVKRLSKTVDNTGKEVRTVLNEHLQPALEIIGFRVGELRGLSRWRARFKSVGLDEKLMDNVTETSGMLLIQAERFSRVLTIVLFLFQNFFNWVLKCTKILLQEPTDQVQQANSELVVVFLKFLLQSDPVEQLLEAKYSVEVDMETMKRIEQMVAFGGYRDVTFLERTLASECNKLEQCLKEAFLMPFTTVSETVACKGLAPLFPVASPTPSTSLPIPMSIHYYKDEVDRASEIDKASPNLTDYTCFKVLDGSLGLKNCIGIVRGFMGAGLGSSVNAEESCLDALLVHLPDQYDCVDLSLYKENQIVLLLNDLESNSETAERSLMVMMQASDLPFVSVSLSMSDNIFLLHQLEDSMMNLDLDIGKFRAIPHHVTVPLAVSASRGLACVFSSQRHTLVYILDEDEDEVSEME
ncbi:Anaphase-promoting complex subunit 4-like protein [Rhynchospora pubera]|uniref:Anaphase-promoting complex subunit 4 n=1 Tax=Rhynchospora pubera TaxID=906938 RepID=A0AAV8CHM3_9POAL|nr:Anaphase-promoting complex subunit 4-like protein [Rhynchospora pubera]